MPLFIKGINLGVSLPGKFPSELSASREQYANWLSMIREAGFNSIRAYTLHYPRFYEVLDSFNTANPQHPILLFQGVWLEEEIPGYNHDLYSLTTYFNKEIEENVDCMHGNRTIQPRLGKAYGEYTTDVSKWVAGYIIGREVGPHEILNTNSLYTSDSTYSGLYLSIHGSSPTETWIVKRLDHLLKREMDLYNTQRPVSFSSWPTLDPMHHPEESNRWEDTASIDLSNIDFSKAKAGFFISFHAYPYYPDFISLDTTYSSYTDYLGQNSYVGYLTHLKEYHKNIPVIIAEFGAPASWGIAHYAQNGVHHGGHDERQQGENYIRLLHNIHNSGCGGGMQFAWIDEWFKRTWITDPVDYNPDRRILWQNMGAAEQCFGLIGFQKTNLQFHPWDTFCPTCYIKSMDAAADFAFFHMRLHTQGLLDPQDTLWLALDTYNSDLGESQFQQVNFGNNRAEFLLLINSYEAKLLVTEAYDLYGIWHGVSGPKQLYHSIPTDGAPWYIVRWRNNFSDQEVQYIGNLSVNRLNLPVSSLDAVIIDTFSIDIRIPWTLLNFIDPSTLLVMHDDRNTPAKEDSTSDGIAVSVYHNGMLQSTSSRFTWPSWNTALDVTEYTKTSYDIIKQELKDMPEKPVAVCDSYNVLAGEINLINAEEGVLKNDLEYDGGEIKAFLVEGPQSGQLTLHEDGSFTFLPEPGSANINLFKYKVISGSYASEPVTVELISEGTSATEGFMKIYPNPSCNEVFIESSAVIDKVEIFNSYGELLFAQIYQMKNILINLETLNSGLYIIRLFSDKDILTKRLVLIKPKDQQ
ncbi:T9SS type A sorting domain-containing protein [candidate division KSB1 bacterium]